MDLGPLYGNNQKEQDKVRIKDGRGKLHPDAFAEDRLLLLPPAVCTLLVLFNRNHNVSIRQISPVFEYTQLIIFSSTLPSNFWRSTKGPTSLTLLPCPETIPPITSSFLHKRNRYSKLQGWSTVVGLEWVCMNLSLGKIAFLFFIFLVVFSDYFSAILGLVRDGSSWSLTPFDVSHISSIGMTLC